MGNTTRSERALGRNMVLIWYALCVNAEWVMTGRDRAELKAWEKDHVDGSGLPGCSTSDWPGWHRFIDVDLFWPWPDEQPPARQR